MANTKSAAKRARQTITRTQRAKRTLTSLKTLLKSARAEIIAKDKDKAKAQVQKLSSALDKAAKAGRIHRNAANRHKARFNQQLGALA